MVVEDQPRRVVDVGEPRHVDDVERVAERVVVGGLVGEPHAVIVDHDRVRASPFGVDLPRHPAPPVDMHVDGRYPPGFPHVGQVCADAHRHPEPIASIGGHTDRARQRPAQECSDEPLVVFEPAGREHDTAAGARLERPVRPFDENAGHPAVVDQQPYPATAELRMHTAVETALEQAPDQRLASPALVAALAPVQLLRTPSGAFRPSDDSLMVISPVICQPTVTRCAQSPRSANGNRVHSSDRPSCFPPGCSGW